MIEKEVLKRIQRVGELYKHKQDQNTPQDLIVVNIGCSCNKDDAFHFIVNNQKNIKKVYLIDAAPEAIQKCKKLYEEHVYADFLKKIELHHIAIVANPNIDTVTMLFPAEDAASGFATTDLEMAINNVVGQLVNTPEGLEAAKENIIDDKLPIPLLHAEVGCSTVNCFFKKIGLKNIDRLYMDIEGLDSDVLLDLDLDYFNIPFILYEHLHLDGYMNKKAAKPSPKHQRLHQKLKNYNFNVYAYGAWNALALNEEMNLSLLH